jgi:hypothetical protein
MATPRVTLRLIKRKKQSMYQLDYSVNGKRLRPAVGSNKKDAELVRAKIQSDLILGVKGNVIPQYAYSGVIRPGIPKESDH